VAAPDAAARSGGAATPISGALDPLSVSIVVAGSLVVACITHLARGEGDESCVVESVFAAGSIASDDARAGCCEHVSNLGPSPAAGPSSAAVRDRRNRRARDGVRVVGTEPCPATNLEDARPWDDTDCSRQLRRSF
jgi:hypothetical protein